MNSQLGSNLFHEPLIDDSFTTDEMICIAELKLQSPLSPSEQRAASNLGFYSLAVGKDILDDGNFGIGLRFSDFPEKDLLSGHHAPLPLFQVTVNASAF